MIFVNKVVVPESRLNPCSNGITIEFLRFGMTSSVTGKS